MATKMTLAEMQRAVWDLVNGAPIVQPNQEGSPPVVRQVLQPRQIASVTSRSAAGHIDQGIQRISASIAK